MPRCLLMIFFASAIYFRHIERHFIFRYFCRHYATPLLQTAPPYITLFSLLPMPRCLTLTPLILFSMPCHAITPCRCRRSADYAAAICRRCHADAAIFRRHYAVILSRLPPCHVADTRCLLRYASLRLLTSAADATLLFAAIDIECRGEEAAVRETAGAKRTAQSPLCSSVPCHFVRRGACAYVSAQYARRSSSRSERHRAASHTCRRRLFRHFPVRPRE